MKKNSANSLGSILKNGDWSSKLSFVVLGAANAAHGQVVKGLSFLALEVLYIYYMVTQGFGNLNMLRTLGTRGQEMVINETLGIVEMVPGDNSMLILLWGVVTCVITAAFLVLWYVSIMSGESARQTQASGKKAPTIVEDLKSLVDGNVHMLLLAIPVAGLVIFTVMPLIYMVLMAFTNYDSSHQPPGNLFTWVGLNNFKLMISSTDKLSSTFWPVLGWTAVWGVSATFSCYFGGIFLAILINSKGAGKTDLLVTWLYKLTRDSKDFNLAATIGILIFIVSATFSLISYANSNALKQEEGFQ